MSFCFFVGLLIDQGRVLTSGGTWLRNRSSNIDNGNKTIDFIPTFKITDVVASSAGVGYGFVANGSVLTLQTTSTTALYVCENIGIVIILFLAKNLFTIPSRKLNQFYLV
jgi:hypothetical protein